MIDKKFLFAVLIILVLGGILIYITVVSPKIQGYIVQKQVQVQQDLIKSMIIAANQQGYITLQDGNDTLVLVKYIPQQQTPQQINSQNTQ
jgi:hypothetical protein